MSQSLDFKELSNSSLWGNLNESSREEGIHQHKNELVQHEKEIPIFYNLYIKRRSRISKAKAIVQEQYDMMLPYHKLLVTSIGIKVSSPSLKFLPPTGKASFIKQLSYGDERDTIQLLWQYCQKVPDKRAHKTTVIYLHSKGSYHHNYVNNVMRKVNSFGALSKECANLPDWCNVCSYRMSPVPFPHTPGNMWLARCSYVKKLVSPFVFQSQVDELYAGRDTCYGKERFAQEHYIHHHHEVMACDLLENTFFTWSYNRQLNENYTKKLLPAPRFNISQFVHRGTCDGVGDDVRHRLELFRHIYNISQIEEISKEWYGWNFYPNSTYFAEKFFELSPASYIKTIQSIS
jgi:hypothetical protein